MIKTSSSTANPVDELAVTDVEALVAVEERAVAIQSP